MSPEWQLDDTAEQADPYHFITVNPKTVFLLALGASCAAVTCVYFAFELVNLAIAAGAIPSPPALVQYVP